MIQALHELNSDYEIPPCVYSNVFIFSCVITNAVSILDCRKQVQSILNKLGIYLTHKTIKNKAKSTKYQLLTVLISLVTIFCNTELLHHIYLYMLSVSRCVQRVVQKICYTNDFIVTAYVKWPDNSHIILKKCRNEDFFRS